MDIIDGSGLWTIGNDTSAPPAIGEFVVTYRRRRRFGAILLALSSAVTFHGLAMKGYLYD